MTSADMSGQQKLLSYQPLNGIEPVMVQVGIVFAWCFAIIPDLVRG
jgi:hypothetical protein